MDGYIHGSESVSIVFSATGAFHISCKAGNSCHTLRVLFYDKQLFNVRVNYSFVIPHKI